MNSIPWLTVLWLTPVVGAVVISLLPPAQRALAKWVGVFFAVAVLAISVSLALRFDPAGAPYQFVESRQWIPDLGTSYTLGVDGVGLVLTLLTAVLVPLLIVAGWNDASDRQHGTQTYVALMLCVEAMVLVSFVALDVLLFYVFFEAMLIPMYFLIGRFGGAGRSQAALKFLLYNLLGGLVMLAAVVGLYVLTAREGTATLDFRNIVALAHETDPGIQKLLFVGFMFAFAVKAPLWPFHTWLPGVASAAKPVTAVLMMAVVDKLGTFGMLRYCLQLFPDASAYFRPLIIALAVISILYGAIVAIGQTDLMRLIAYTSISHFGFIVLGVFAMTSQGQAGATLYMVNHGVSTAALFLIAGFLVSRRGTSAIAAFGGVSKVAPVLAGTFLVAGVSALALPGLAPFISEFLVLIGAFTRYPVAAVLAATALVLSAIYVLWAYQRMMTGPLTDGNDRIHDLVRRERVVVAPLLALLLVLGIYPKPALDLINPAISHTLTTIGQHDPAPEVMAK
ncbi:proton-translocating NADH-quinone oxidoreductase subunit M [Mycobacterium lentiflavum]|uniref:Proton-translocating NADH-quinone oxidoreductase subunit M n=1 Tax=Mycobacterium lentiflavum TaxID=141349 RepID=A0A0E4H2C1_MYCLN|nr:proton-translocating NADH-quinone oxidoreductase subunit M [Mycobacterium lentiflavum]